MFEDLGDLGQIDFTELATNPQLAIIPFLWFMGFLIKRSEKIADKYIPSVIAVVGLILGLLLVTFSVNGAIVGVLYAATVVATHTGIKQLTKKED